MRPETTFWFSSRAALWQLVRALELRRGDVMAVPAYSSGLELEALVQAGIVLRFFSVTAHLDPEPRSFRIATDGAAAALVTHYFGVPADVDDAVEVCRVQGVPLVEHSADALEGAAIGEPVGAGGPTAVEALRATLRLPRGGALVLHGVPPVGRASGPWPRMVVFRGTRRLLARYLRSDPTRALPLVLSMGTLTQSVVAAPSGGADGVRYDVMGFGVMMGARTRPRGRSVRLATGSKQRRERYRELAVGIDGLMRVRPLWSELPAGASPLLLPVMAEQPAALRRVLGARGLKARIVWPWMHPRVPWEQFPHEAALKRGIVGLSLYPSLRDRDVARAIDAVRRWAAA